MAERMADRVMRLMLQQDKIRNIAICAHIDHGKCVKGDTRLSLVNGEHVSAKHLFEKIAREGKTVRQSDSETVFMPKDAEFVFSLNKTSGKIEKKPISYAWKLRGGNLIEMTLRSGASISTTPEHRYLVLEDMDFKEKEAHELRLGDRIVCARQLDIEQKKKAEDVKSEIITLLGTKEFYINLKEPFAEEIKKKILIYGLKNIEKQIAGIKIKSFYRGLWKNRLRLRDVLVLKDILQFDNATIYGCIAFISLRKGGQRGKSTQKIILPENPEGFYTLAGLFIGDGTGNKFVVGKKELGDLFITICECMGFSPVKRRYQGKTEELCANTTLIEILKTLFDYPTKQKSHHVCVSRFLSTSPQEYVAAFLRAYFDCDGTVEKSRSAISLTSVSEKMLRDLQLLLLRFGIVSIHQGDTLYISGDSAQKYAKEISFFVTEKKNKAKKLVKKSIGSYALDTIPLSQETLGALRKVPMAQLGQHYYKYEKQIITPTRNKFLEILNTFEQKQGNLQTLQLHKIAQPCLAFIEVTNIRQDFAETVYDFTIEDNHNFVAEGMIIHNTTFSDNLLAGAGMMSEELAGSARMLDFHEDEIARGITIDAANVSMVHKFEEQEYLINLIDTPGHVDFGGDVTRAMRAVDGCIVLVDAVEGIMPQTETVLRQALKERVKPILFINKVDRLIRELQLTPEAMQERFVKIITEVNHLIRDIAEQDYGERFQINVQNGSVCFGSAFHNWALSLPYMQRKSMTFKMVIDAYKSSEDAYKELKQKAPLHEIILGAVIRHLPNPIDAQKYRIPKLWKGELESEEGKSLLACNPNGPLFFVITKIVVDPQAGEISAGRLFGGTIQKGMEVYLNRVKQKLRVQQVFIYNGAKREIVDKATSGNIIGVAGLKAMPGETITLQPTEPFEEITHLFEPVVTKAIEAKKPSDLPRLIEVLQLVQKEDPCIKVQINEETGEHLMSGMGELHLEVIENRIRTDKGLEIKTSQPIVVYRETVTKESPICMGKSPNKHNHLFFKVEPLPTKVLEAIKKGELPMKLRAKKKDLALRDKLVALGFNSKFALTVKGYFNYNLLLDQTKGEIHIGEIIEMVFDMFEDVMNASPIAREPSFGVMVSLMDCKLHEDAIHRGPAQLYPAVREGIREAYHAAGPMIYEPVQILQFEAPVDYMGNLSKLIANKRGQLLDMQQSGIMVTIKAKMPVAEMIGMSNDLRSATGGRGNSFVIDQNFELLPRELQARVIAQIRSRKGLTENQ